MHTWHKELVGVHSPALPKAVRPINGLLLVHRVEVGLHQDHAAGKRQVQPLLARHQAHLPPHGSALLHAEQKPPGKSRQEVL